MYCPECGEKIPENSKFCPMCGLNINEFYKNKYSNKNEEIKKEEKSFEEDIKQETKEEKAKRFEEILKNSGNIQETKSEEEIENCEVSNKSKGKNDLDDVEDELDLSVNEKNSDDKDIGNEEKNYVEKPSDDENVEDDEEVHSENSEDTQREWEEDSLSRAKDYMENPDREESPIDLRVMFSEINFKIMKTIFNPLKSFIEILESPKGFYKDFFIILSTLFILVTNTDVIRKSSPTQTLSVNRFLITIVVSVFALAMIILKPYIIMTFDKWDKLKEVKDCEKFSKIVAFAVITSVMRLLFYILIDFVPGVGLILGYGVRGRSVVLFIIFMILETLILEGILMNKWKDKRDLKNLALSSIVVFGIEIFSIIVFKPIVTMMISKL